MGDASDSDGGSPGGLPTQAGDSAGGGGFKFSPASTLSIASLGLSAFSGINKAKGVAAADEFQSERALRAAQFGKLQASLTDSVARENLNTTLANIDVIRSAARTDPTSPTGAAIEARDKFISDRQRNVALLNINQQVSEDEASAAFLHKAGNEALVNANLMAGLSVPAAVAKAMV